MIRKKTFQSRRKDALEQRFCWRRYVLTWHRGLRNASRSWNLFPQRWHLQDPGPTPAITQQALATALGTLPSRLVALVDDLKSKGLLERRPHESDRRSYALHLTEKGQSTLQAIGRIAPEHHKLCCKHYRRGPASAFRSCCTCREATGINQGGASGIWQYRPARKSSKL